MNRRIQRPSQVQEGGTSMKLRNVVTGFAAQLLDLAARAARGTAMRLLAEDSVLAECDPTEPVFLLCGRDPDALESLEVWLSLRTANLGEARRKAGVDGATPGTEAYQRLERQRAKLHDAANIAHAFGAWQDRAARLERKAVSR